MMSDIMNVLNYLFEWAISGVSTVVGCIVGQPLLLCFVVLGLVGLAVGFLRRLIRL